MQGLHFPRGHKEPPGQQQPQISHPIRPVLVAASTNAVRPAQYKAVGLCVVVYRCIGNIKTILFVQAFKLDDNSQSRLFTSSR